MQGIPDNLLLDQYPQYLSQETDTATPRTPVPIFYFHTEEQPFCSNVHCVCQRGKRAGALLYPQLAKGALRLAQMKTGRTKIIVDTDRNSPESCQLYGHNWQTTEHPDIKECSLCHVRGYCPACTPITPAGAQAFYCTYHAGREAQQ